MSKNTIRGTTRHYPRSLLFNIFISDILSIIKTKYFTCYADDNTPLVAKDDTKDAIKALEESGETFIKWFSKNRMKVNTEKCHLFLNSSGPNTMKIGNLCIKYSLCEKSFAINFDYLKGINFHG